MGTTYEYEKGRMELTQLHWSETEGKLTQTGAKFAGDGEKGLVEVIGTAKVGRLCW